MSIRTELSTFETRRQSLDRVHSTFSKNNNHNSLIAPSHFCSYHLSFVSRSRFAYLYALLFPYSNKHTHTHLLVLLHFFLWLICFFFCALRTHSAVPMMMLSLPPPFTLRFFLLAYNISTPTRCRTREVLVVRVSIILHNFTFRFFFSRDAGATGKRNESAGCGMDGRSGSWRPF